MWVAFCLCLEVCVTCFGLLFSLFSSCWVQFIVTCQVEKVSLTLLSRRGVFAQTGLRDNNLMNLYRSFGCLLEAWVAEGYPDMASSSGEGSEKNLDPNSSDSASTSSFKLLGGALRSESEDSGVELPSALSQLTSHLEPGREDLRPSCSSPALSQCSTSSSCFSAAHRASMKGSEGSGLLVEETLRRTESAWRRSVDGSQRRRCNTASVTSDLQASIRQRAGHLGPGRSQVRAPAEQPKLENIQHTPSISDREPAENTCDLTLDWECLSPGLMYLEQMCRMLETIAGLQQHNQHLQLQIESIQNHKDMEVSSSTGTEALQLRGDKERVRFSPDEFRRRSVSDTWTFSSHRGKWKGVLGERFKSTDVLMEEPDGSQQDKPEQRKESKSLMLRIASLGRNEKTKPSRSTSEKKMTFRLFRNRRKTTRF